MNRNKSRILLSYAVLLLVAATLFSACGGGGGGSSPSPYPAAPTTLTANAISVSRIDLTWADRSDNETGFKIERSTNSQFPSGPTTTIVGTVTANATSYSSTGLAPSTTYYYRVRAYNSAGDSGNTNVVNASTFTVSTLAGVVTTSSGTITYVPPLSGSADGPGPAARFKYPYSIASSNTDLYVADTMNHVIRKIDKSSGAVTTLAGSPTVTGSADSSDGTGATARFNYPYGITLDGTDLYVSDTMNQVIRKVNTSTGEVITIAGTMGVSGSTNADGTSAQFNQPIGITTDSSYIYVADSLNHTIRKYNRSTKAVTTLAGSALVSGATDSTGGLGARFNQPFGVAMIGTDLFVTDYNNHTIRKVDINGGLVTTISGTALITGTTNSIGTAARFNNPAGITANGALLYVADSQNHTIRQIDINNNNTVSTLVGTPGVAGATSTTFNHPYGVTWDGTDLYVADTYNHDIRKVVQSGTPYTASLVAGYDVSSVSTRVFYWPMGITSAGTGSYLYVTDNRHNSIRQVDVTTGETTTLAGSGSANYVDGIGTAAAFYYPEGIASDGTDLYVADTYTNTIRRIIISSATVTTIAGVGQWDGGYADGIGTAAMFNHPVGIATDGTYLYVTDHGNHTIRKINIATQQVTTLAGLFNTTGSADSTNGTGDTARFKFPTGISAIGNYLYVLDYDNQTIRKVHKDTGNTTTLAGKVGITPIVGQSGDSTDGTGKTALFNDPRGISTDGVYLYVADTGNSTIRRVDPNTGDTVTLAGSAGQLGSADSTTSAARFNVPNGVFWESGILYVADTNNNTIRVVY